MTKGLLLATFLAASAAALAQETAYAPPRPLSEQLQPEQEARVMRLGRQLRCAVCQGVSIADSPASMARAQLDKVRELVLEGKSDQEIRDYFVARYGEWALLEPTSGGLNSFLWLGPVAMLVVGALLILGQVRKGQAGVPAPAAGPDAAAGPAAGAGAPPAPAAADDAFLAQVKKDLES